AISNELEELSRCASGSAMRNRAIPLRFFTPWRHNAGGGNGIPLNDEPHADLDPGDRAWSVDPRRNRGDDRRRETSARLFRPAEEQVRIDEHRTEDRQDRQERRRSPPDRRRHRALA